MPPVPYIESSQDETRLTPNSIKSGGSSLLRTKHLVLSTALQPIISQRHYKQSCVGISSVSFQLSAWPRPTPAKVSCTLTLNVPLIATFINILLVSMAVHTTLVFTLIAGNLQEYCLSEESGCYTCCLEGAADCWRNYGWDHCDEISK
jgi:hypothetical protein